MSVEKMREILALIIVGGFMILMFILALVPLLTQLASPTVMGEYMKTVGSLFAGIVGSIVGFYFGKRSAGQ